MWKTPSSRDLKEVAAQRDVTHRDSFHVRVSLRLQISHCQVHFRYFHFDPRHHGTRTAVSTSPRISRMKKYNVIIIAAQSSCKILIFIPRVCLHRRIQGLETPITSPSAPSSRAGMYCPPLDARNNLVSQGRMRKERRTYQYLRWDLWIRRTWRILYCIIWRIRGRPGRRRIHVCLPYITPTLYSSITAAFTQEQGQVSSRHTFHAVTLTFPISLACQSETFSVIQSKVTLSGALFTVHLEIRRGAAGVFAPA